MSKKEQYDLYSSRSIDCYRFPAGFLWGAATSSHQVEGNNRNNDWWQYEKAGKLPYNSGAACDHYELYDRDFEMVASWGHNAHRFSIEWSRIEPSEGVWDKGATEHYRKVIKSLKRHNIEPMVTLHHFTNPAWFSLGGGWLHKDSVKLFTRYADFIIRQLGEDVKYWITINEPTVYVLNGYMNGVWPPFEKSSWINSTLVLKNIASAHLSAFKAMHQKCKDIMVGFAHNTPFIVPCNPKYARDRFTAAIRDFILNKLFFYLIGYAGRNVRKYTQHFDFVGLNYYTRIFIRSASKGIKAVLGKTCHHSQHRERGRLSETGSEVYPLGLEKVIEKFTKMGLPIIITENGLATTDELLRREFIFKHLESLAIAITKGANVLGYFYWTLMDNYEWEMGNEAHYGLAAVDLNTQKRIPRPCVEDYKRICLENRLSY